jgi:heat shock protein HslJ
MRMTIGLIGVSMAAVLAGCVGGSGGTGGNLEGDWQLTSQSVDGSMAAIPAGVSPDATFKGGAMAGSTGCNRYAATYAVDGNALKIVLGPMTLIGCQPPASDVESAYIANLSKVSTFTATSDSLTMYDSGGTAILAYSVLTPASLTGVTWHVTGYNNGNGGVVSVAIGSDPTALFDAAGTVSGDASCNTFTGPAVVDGAAAIKIGPLVTTRRACVDNAVNAQETQYLAALEGATTYSIHGTTLELRDADGALMVGFEER